MFGDPGRTHAAGPQEADESNGRRDEVPRFGHVAEDLRQRSSVTLLGGKLQYGSRWCLLVLRRLLDGGVRLA